MGRPSIYPWDEWFDGGKHILVHGIDFDVEPLVMQKQVQITARRRGAQIATRRRGGTVELGPRGDFGFTLDEPVTEMAPIEEEHDG